MYHFVIEMYTFLLQNGALWNMELVAFVGFVRQAYIAAILNIITNTSATTIATDAILTIIINIAAVPFNKYSHCCSHC